MIVSIKKFLVLVALISTMGSFLGASVEPCKKEVVKLKFTKLQKKAFNELYKQAETVFKKRHQAPTEDELKKLKQICLRVFNFDTCPFCKGKLSECANVDKDYAGRRNLFLVHIFEPGASNNRGFQPHVCHEVCYNLYVNLGTVLQCPHCQAKEHLERTTFQVKWLGKQLYWAAKDGDVALVKDLLSQGADATIYDNYWNTAYDVAASPAIAALVKPSYWSRIQRFYDSLGCPLPLALNLVREKSAVVYLLSLIGFIFAPNQLFYQALKWGAFLEEIVFPMVSVTAYHIPAAERFRPVGLPRERRFIDNERMFRFLKILALGPVVGFDVPILLWPRLGSAAFFLFDLFPLLTGAMWTPQERHYYHKIFFGSKLRTALSTLGGLGIAYLLLGNDVTWIGGLTHNLAKQLLGAKQTILPQVSLPLPLVNATISNIAPPSLPLVNGTLPMAHL